MELLHLELQTSPGTDRTIGYGAQTGKWSKGNAKEGIYNDGYRPVLVLNSTKLLQLKI